MQDVVRRLDKAFAAFFRRIKAGDKPGYPRFQGRTRYHSFTYGEYGNGARLDGGLLSLSKIGRVPIRLHRPIEGTAKTVTISREADGWYACISCADVATQPLPLTGQETGIDVGLTSFLALADGTFVENPRHSRTAEKALKRAQRRVSRRKKGSKRRRKAVKLLAKKHQKVARQRRDFHYKAALVLVRRYDTIYHEAIQTKNLSARPQPKPDGNGGYLPNGARAKAGLNKSINDAGWSQFLSILACKAVYAGKRVEAVPPAYTSQDCSGCGERVPKSLSVRTHVCPSCGLVLDRDTNAALNILRAGQVREASRGVGSGDELRSPFPLGMGSMSLRDASLTNKEQWRMILDTVFWQAMKDNDFAVPPGYSVEALTKDLLAALGNPNPAVREGPNHEVLETWIHRGVYAPDALRAMAKQVLDNLKVGLGEAGTDTVFLRTFSMLILTEIVQEDHERPFLSEAELRSYMEQGLAYLEREQDVRGYVPGKGWAHAVAHAADFFMALARHRYLQAADLERLLQAGARKLKGPPTIVYLYEEDERMAYAVLTALRRNLLPLPFLAHWIENVAQPEGVPWHISTFYTAEQTIRYHNLKTFLRSLYFQLRLATSPPQDTPTLLSMLEEAIRAMDRGYYALP